jgi:hypothetical protein
MKYTATILSSVSALALNVSIASAIVLPQPAREPQMSAEAIDRAANKTVAREFTVFLKPDARASESVVENYFKSVGFITEYHAITNAIKLHGTYALAEAAGHFEYVRTTDPKVLITPNAEPSFPAEIVNAIQGTTFRRGPLLTPQGFPTPPYGTPSTMPCYGTGSNNCGFGPADYAALYDFPKGIDGSGETIDIAAFTTYCASDLTKFQSTFGLTPAPNITTIYFRVIRAVVALASRRWT